MSSHLTAISRSNPSTPCQILYGQNLIRGKVLDFGCGRGADYLYLKDNGIDAYAYDLYYFPLHHIFEMRNFDTILCTYVLNVLPPEERKAVVKSVIKRLGKNGIAYFTLRGDTIKGTPYLDGVFTSKNTFQKSYTAESALTEFPNATLVYNKRNIVMISIMPK
jgi:SAM-dependent methyltransferase